MNTLPNVSLLLVYHLFLAGTEKVVTSDFTEQILATSIVKTLTAETETGLNFITHVMVLVQNYWGGGQKSGPIL